MNLIRSFIAIPIPENICKEVGALQQELRREMPELRTGASENLHLTLRFLGDQSEEQLAKIGRFMLSVTGSEACFSVHLKGLGTFPGRKRPRVLWTGVHPSEPLINLERKLSVGLAELGCPAESKTYRPHLTLGRFKRPPATTDAIFNRQNIDFGILQVESVVLYSSRLTPQGAVHQPLTVAKLKSR